MELEFKSVKVEIFTKNKISGTYGLIIRSPRLAGQINRVLQHYPKKHKFDNTDEALFVFNVSQIEYIMDASPIMHKILTQLIRPVVGRTLD